MCTLPGHRLTEPGLLRTRFTLCRIQRFIRVTLGRMCTKQFFVAMASVNFRLAKLLGFGRLRLVLYILRMHAMDRVASFFTFRTAVFI